MQIEDLLGALQTPLLYALREARGGDESAAAFYWPGGKRLGRTRWARISVPFRVPADGPWRVRAGFISWEPPGSFFVQLAPDQRWDAPVFGLEADTAVRFLREHGFDGWMAAYLALTPEFLAAPDLERRIIKWARDRFGLLQASGILDLPLGDLGPVTAPPDGAL